MRIYCQTNRPSEGRYNTSWSSPCPGACRPWAATAVRWQPRAGWSALLIVLWLSGILLSVGCASSTAPGLSSSEVRVCDTERRAWPQWVDQSLLFEHSAADAVTADEDRPRALCAGTVICFATSADFAHFCTRHGIPQDNSTTLSSEALRDMLDSCQDDYDAKILTFPKVEVAAGNSFAIYLYPTACGAAFWATRAADLSGEDGLFTFSFQGAPTHAHRGDEPEWSASGHARLGGGQACVSAADRHGAPGGTVVVFQPSRLQDVATVHR